MPFLIEHIFEVVLTIVIVVLLGAGSLVVATIARRQRREKYFQRIDELRQRYAPVIAAVLAQKLEYERALAVLKGISGLDREQVLEQLLLEKKPTADQVPILRRLSEDLGLVRLWQERLSGRVSSASIRDAIARPGGILERVGRLHFLVRAKAADSLGIIQHRPSWPLLVRALEDPHPDVQIVAVRALAAIQEPDSFASLVQRLQAVVLKPTTTLSLRAVKTALVSFPLKQAVGLIPSLNHSHRRIRFLATDIIREIVERHAAWEEEFVLDAKIFPPELTETFLNELCFDENPDVRARTAPVISRLADPRATPVLLTLLEDPQWFVRLHAVRALAKRKYLSQAPRVAQRLTDPHWMVREAAARTLLVFGRVGSDHLASHFLSTEDRYSREQIADEMQRAGLIPGLLAQFGSAEDDVEANVLEQFAQMGKTSYLVAVLRHSSEHNLRKKFIERFGRYPDPQIRAWLRHIATEEPDEELRALAEATIRQAAR
jgi:HEAT repeat protein